MVRSLSLARLGSFSIRKNTYVKLLLSFILLNILNISIVFGLYYWNADRIMKREIDELSHRLLSQTQNVSNYVYTSVIKGGYDLYGDDTIYAAMFSDDEVDVFDQHLLFTRLNRFIQANPIVHSIYLYNRQLDTVISTEYPNLSFANFPDKEMTAALGDFRYRSPRIPYFLRNAMPGKPAGSPTLSLIMTEPSSGSDEVQGAMVLNMDDVQLQKLMTEMAGDPTNRLYLLQNDGEFITPPDSPLFADERSRFRYYGDIESSAASAGTLIEHAGGQKYVISYQRTNLESTGFVYLSIYPYTTLFKSLIHIRNVTMLSSGFLIVASLALSVLLSRRIYFPIRSLTQFARKQWRGSPAPEDGDLETISRVLAKAVEDNESLERLSYRTRKLLREQFLRSLLLGYEESRSSFRTRVAEHGIELVASERIRVAILRIDRYRQFEEKYDSESRFLIRYAMGNIVEETLEKTLRAQSVDIGSDHIAVLLDDSSTGEQELGRMLKEVQRNVRSYLQLGVTVGIGDPVESLAEASYSYEGALAATHRRVFRGPGALIAGSKPEPAGRIDYPFDKEKAILDELRLGRPNKLKEAVDRLLGSLEDEIGRDPFAVAAEVVLNVMKAAHALPGRALPPSVWSYGDLYGQLTRLESREEIVDWIGRQLLKETEGSEADDRKTRNADTIAKGLQYIEENYRRTDFSVADVASYLQYSASYVNKLFGETIGMTVHESINRKRLLKAKELVEGSDLLISDIAGLSGFSSSNYFYYVFKKEFGLTPIACRKMSGEAGIPEPG
ncbi:helix-turn-helix domain-containing protein [Cohnella zeiphila]|uniref:AraC family transcriptional regulator n=1 Tax=Cohnella zeiphila TaxID=2761120 RepID=A0A7X0SNW6_9BACL|nr:helix-turn-helix domain-containing protein [Cohnella zeiphila]MBB6733457.1 AraC family transcriptional regulator [Cohnella zeiphila]